MFMNRYYIVTGSYGFLRKAIRLKNATLKRERYNKEKCDIETYSVPMLTSTKIIVAAACTVVSPWVWPGWLYSDICRLEMIMRKLSPKAYNINESETITCLSEP